MLKVDKTNKSLPQITNNNMSEVKALVYDILESATLKDFYDCT